MGEKRDDGVGTASEEERGGRELESSLCVCVCVCVCVACSCHSGQWEPQVGSPIAGGRRHE